MGNPTIPACSECETHDHDDWPPNTFGAMIRCLRAQATRLGLTNLVDQVDTLRRDVDSRRDTILRDHGTVS